MTFLKILLGSIVVFCFPILGILINPDGSLTYLFQPLICPIAALFYFFLVKKKRILLNLFFIFFVTADFLHFLVPAIPFHDLANFIVNGFYIAAYTSLFLEILTVMHFSVVINKYKMSAVVLLLSIYVIITLQYISDHDYKNQYVIEFLYHGLITLATSASVLNFFYYGDKKSFYLFLACLFLLIQEVLSVGYFCINKRALLYIMMCVLSACAYSFLIMEAQLNYKKPEPPLCD